MKEKESGHGWGTTLGFAALGMVSGLLIPIPYIGPFIGKGSELLHRAATKEPSPSEQYFNWEYGEDCTGQQCEWAQLHTAEEYQEFQDYLAERGIEPQDLDPDGQRVAVGIPDIDQAKEASDDFLTEWSDYAEFSADMGIEWAVDWNAFYASLLS